MYESNIKKDLARKYAIKHFLSLKEKISEWVWHLATVAIALTVICYIVAQLFVFIINHK